MLNLIGEGVAKGAKKALQETAEEVGEKAVAKTAKRTAKEAAIDISKKVAQKYGDKADEIMAYYGSDLAKKGDNSFLGKILSGKKVQDPLVMFHGVDETKLKQMMDIADETYSDYAIPNPSLQVVDPNKGVGGNYGDIILLGNKSMPGGINKYSGKPDLYGGNYRLFSRDIYSPRRPIISYDKGIPYISNSNVRATPQNISDWMNKQGLKAAESSYATPGSMAATQAKRYKNPLEAIQDQARLLPTKDAQVTFKQWNDDLEAEIQKFLDDWMDNNPGENPYVYRDYIAETLQDAMSGKRAWDDPYGIYNTKAGREAVDRLKTKAKNLPTTYFEGKANRAVPISEFGGAVLPEGFNDPKIIKMLNDNGVYIEGFYDPENYEESLQQMLQGLAKKKDRLTTPYLLGLGTLLGGGAMLGYNNKKKEG